MRRRDIKGTAMAYVEDRTIHDADAHTMEPPEWLEPFASAAVARYALDHFSIGDNDKAFADIEEMEHLPADVQERFFRLNFEDLMGTAAYIPAAAA